MGPFPVRADRPHNPTNTLPDAEQLLSMIGAVAATRPLPSSRRPSVRRANDRDETIAIAQGAAFALAADIAMARLIPRRRTAVAAVGLVAAAAVYPLSRRRWAWTPVRPSRSPQRAPSRSPQPGCPPRPPVAYWASVGRRTRHTTRSSPTSQPPPACPRLTPRHAPELT